MDIQLPQNGGFFADSAESPDGFATNDFEGMGFKSHHSAGKSVIAGILEDMPDKEPVSAVHAVKITDRQRHGRRFLGNIAQDLHMCYFT